MNFSNMTDEYYVIGLMSGTSMDGLDLAYVHFQRQESKWSFKIIYAETVSYSPQWLDDLNNARSLETSELDVLDEAYGSYLGIAVHNFLEKYAIQKVDFVASHGHTIHHRPNEGITVQIGSSRKILNEINLPVVNDFRTCLLYTSPSPRDS